MHPLRPVLRRLSAERQGDPQRHRRRPRADRVGRPVYASVAPSFVANYPGATIAGMEKALRALGFAGASETAVGATTVKTVYDEMCERGDDDVIISSCCHTVNLLIRKYFPQAIGCLAPVLSPMQAHCKSLKALHPDAAAVFIGPCISKKDEAAQYPGRRRFRADL